MHLFTYFVIIFISLSSFSFGQAGEIQIRFIGNCGLHLTDGETDIYVDFPYKSGAYSYMTFDESELENVKENAIFIFTHKHKDHFSGKNMRRVLKEKGGKKFTPWRSKKLKKHAETIPDFEIEIFKTKHTFSLRHRSYLITWHGKRIYLSGDTEHPETIANIKNIDMAFVPYWIIREAKKKDLSIDAKKIGIYHIATEQIPSLKEHYASPENVILMAEQGKSIELK